MGGANGSEPTFGIREPSPGDRERIGTVGIGGDGEDDGDLRPHPDNPPRDDHRVAAGELLHGPRIAPARAGDGTFDTVFRRFGGIDLGERAPRDRRGSRLAA